MEKSVSFTIVQLGFTKLRAWPSPIWRLAASMTGYDGGCSLLPACCYIATCNPKQHKSPHVRMWSTSIILVVVSWIRGNGQVWSHSLTLKQHCNPPQITHSLQCWKIGELDIISLLDWTNEHFILTCSSIAKEKKLMFTFTWTLNNYRHLILLFLMLYSNFFENCACHDTYLSIYSFLSEVLIRFRRPPVALMCHIENADLYPQGSRFILRDFCVGNRLASIKSTEDAIVMEIHLEIWNNEILRLELPLSLYKSKLCRVYSTSTVAQIGTTGRKFTKARTYTKRRFITHNMKKDMKNMRSSSVSIRCVRPL